LSEFAWREHVFPSATVGRHAGLDPGVERLATSARICKGITVALDDATADCSVLGGFIRFASYRSRGAGIGSSSEFRQSRFVQRSTIPLGKRRPSAVTRAIAAVSIGREFRGIQVRASRLRRHPSDSPSV